MTFVAQDMPIVGRDACSIMVMHPEPSGACGFEPRQVSSFAGARRSERRLRTANRGSNSMLGRSGEDNSDTDTPIVGAAREGIGTAQVKVLPDCQERLAF